MRELTSMLRNTSSPPVLYDGIISTGATSVSDKVQAILPAFHSEMAWGPAPWSPRVDDSGDPVYPSAGDRCIVALAESDHPGAPEAWVVAWWPYD